jgi:hypothetical protein
MHIRAITSVVALIFGGCAIHPLQDNATGLPIIDIVQKVRCEARDAILKYDTKWRPHPKKMNERVYEFDDSAIAYNFTFTATESNDATAGGDLTVPTHKGAFRISVGVGGHQTRRGDRVFKVADLFSDLRKADFCATVVGKESGVYPITGSTGLEEVIATFIRLAKSQEALSDLEDYTDTVTFTTKINGSVNPSISLIPGARKTANFGVNLAAEREDTHKVLIGLTVPLTPAEIAAIKEAKIVKVRLVDSALSTKVTPQIGGAPTPKTGLPQPTKSFDAKQRALRAVEKERAQKTQQDILLRLPPN